MARATPTTLRLIALAVMLAAAVATALLGRRGGEDRPAALPLLVSVDGPGPSEADRAIVYLHGLGGDLRQGEALARSLREAGLPSGVAVISLEGPYAGRSGQHWGGTAAAQALSRARIREALRPWLERPRLPLTVAGFSQGAGVAADLAVEEPRLSALAAFAPCRMWLRGELPRRNGLRVLLAHGAHDEVCPPEESRSLAPVLERAGVPVRYLEFDGGHTVPPEAVAALVALSAATDGGAMRLEGGMASTEGAVEVVERQLAAYNARDLAAFAATYADDVVITEGEPPKVIVEGKDALRRRYGDLFARFPRSHARVADRQTAGAGVVIDHEIITGRAPERPDPWDAGRVRYEVEDGLIRRVHLP